MTWEETILMIRKKDEFRELVAQAYFDEDLILNIERFQNSKEFNETLKIIKQYSPKGATILDIGSGNGVSAVSFALQGYTVTAVEPDISDTVGAGAIRKLKEHYQLNGLTVHPSFAEDIQFADESFDIVYVRQAMHHANDLNDFVAECARVLKKGGLLLTVRDHVVYNSDDKQWFLDTHALHKYYGGENAYSSEEYRNAITQAGGKIYRELKYFDSVINYYPMSSDELQKMRRAYLLKVKKQLQNKIGFISQIPLVFQFYKFVKGINPEDGLNEGLIPGRMYSYIAIKQ